MVTVIVRIPQVGDKPTFEQRIEVSAPAIPIPEIPEICEIGDEKKVTCPDGTAVVTARCEKDTTTGRNKWVLTGKSCPPLELGKTVKIITYPEGAEFEAYDGQEMTVTASVMCGLTRSSGEQAVFQVDAVEAARANTTNGFVSFKWKATVEPSRTHKLCVSVPKSDKCPNYGSARDCKTIFVSRQVPGIEEQLKKEREAYQLSLKAMEDERKRIRELYQTVPAATGEAEAQVISPTISITPEITPPEVTLPPRLGTIKIPLIPKPFKIEFPINIKIDGESKGEPPISVDVEPGTHIITAELRGFTPISRKVRVESGQTVTISDIIFGG